MNFTIDTYLHVIMALALSFVACCFAGKFIAWTYRDMPVDDDGGGSLPSMNGSTLTESDFVTWVETQWR